MKSLSTTPGKKSAAKAAALPKETTAKPQRTGKVSTGARQASQTNLEMRHQMIATAAYYRAERRGFQDGSLVDDWIEAEAEIDASLGSI